MDTVEDEEKDIGKSKQVRYLSIHAIMYTSSYSYYHAILNCNVYMLNYYHYDYHNRS